jgi:hypothetical protein
MIAYIIPLLDAFEDMCNRAACDIKREDGLKEHRYLLPIHKALPYHRRGFITEFEKDIDCDCMDYDDPCHLQLLFLSNETMKEDIAESNINDLLEEQYELMLKVSRQFVCAAVVNLAVKLAHARAYRSAARPTFAKNKSSGDSGDPDQPGPPGPSHSVTPFTSCSKKSNNLIRPRRNGESWRMDRGRAA